MNEDTIISIIAVLFIVFTATLIVCILASVVMDSLSVQDCKILGYDTGDQMFWKGQTICWNVLEESKEEVREYYFIEK